MRLSQFTMSAVLAASTSMDAVQASSHSAIPDFFDEEDRSIQKSCPRHDGDVTRGRDLQGLPPSAIISNGLIKLGVNPTAQLNAPGGSYEDLGYTSIVGLRYIFPDGRESESTSYGCECEGWGASADGTAGWANDSSGGVVVDIPSVTFSSTATTAISELTLPGGLLKVTHDFHPSPATDNLYEVTVTLENISNSTINDVRYRRVMDWDIYPTPYSECVTIQPDPSLVSFLTTANDNGFNHPNPLLPLMGLVSTAPLSATAPFTNDGPYDHGAGFDFRFDPLAVGASYSFNIYYGAAENTAAAEEAISKVAAEVYSFGSPSTSDGNCADTPNVYIFAFSGVGGPALFNAPPNVVCQDHTLLSTTCSVDSIDPSLLDGGSSDPNGDDIVLAVSPAGPYTGGENVITLSATDAGGLSSFCEALFTVICPPTAVCQNTTILSATCSVDSIDPYLVDGGSFDPDGGAPDLSILTPGPFTGGENLVTLSATDVDGFSSACEAVVTVICPPTAVCQDVAIEAGAGCRVDSLDPSVVGGLSSDLTGEINIAISGLFPLALGSHLVNVTVINLFGFADSCVANVTVFDGEPLVEDAIDCGTNGVMSRCDESAKYTPSYIKSNGCPVQTEVSVVERRFCNSAGKTIIGDTECYLSTNGKTLFVFDTGLAGNHMIYTVAVSDTNEEHEASKTCTICVEEPDGGCAGESKSTKNSSTKSKSEDDSKCRDSTSNSSKSNSSKSRRLKFQGKKGKRGKKGGKKGNNSFKCQNIFQCSDGK